MNKLIILFVMIFCHIVDNYYLQGWLASAKQRNYWKENCPEKLYRYDYICALCIHAYSWSFMISLPIIIYKNFHINIIFIICFLLNIMIHAYVDNLKANKKVINLVADQSIHICQILIMFIINVIIV